MNLYKIVTIADIHWGAMNPIRLYLELIYFIEFIKNAPDELKPDLIVIAGDYFDDKLSMNSESANKATQFITELSDLCITKNIQLRIIQGTLSHDNKQLRIISANLENENTNLKIFMENTLEETLPGLQCLYCPDETINIKDYYRKYINNLIPEKPINIGFFHGSFDVILPDIVLQKTEIESIENVVFEYDKFSKLINGPLIAGHFHNGIDYNDLYYVGSYSRWAFEEDDPKGFLYTIYDVNEQKYFCKRVNNPYAEEYLTYVIDTMLYTNVEQYQSIINVVKSTLNDIESNGKIRLKIIIYDESQELTNFINLIKFSFINDKRVKIVLDNKKKIKEKKKRLSETKIEENKFSYLYTTDTSLDQIYQKIQRFILEEYKKEIPLEDIIQFFKSHESELEDKLIRVNTNNE